MTKLLTDDVLAAVQRLAPIAADAGLSRAQLAVAWTLQNPSVSAAIVGATRPEQVRDNVKAAGVRLDADMCAPGLIYRGQGATSPAAGPRRPPDIPGG